MTKPKTLEQLRAEKERAETQLAQEQHKLERLENRVRFARMLTRAIRKASFCSQDAPACAVPVQAASRLVPFRFGAVQGFSVLSL